MIITFVENELDYVAVCWADRHYRIHSAQLATRILDCVQTAPTTVNPGNAD